MKRATRSYTDRTVKLLWGRAAGRCAMPECRIELFADATEYDPIVTIGEMAHGAAASDGGPRANPKLRNQERNDYNNLLPCAIRRAAQHLLRGTLAGDKGLP